MYEKLDELIVAKVKDGHNKSINIFDDEVLYECRRLVFGTSRPAFRVLDQRLQALRKRGILKFAAGSGWTAFDPNACQCKGGGDCRECPR